MNSVRYIVTRIDLSTMSMGHGPAVSGYIVGGDHRKTRFLGRLAFDVFNAGQHELAECSRWDVLEIDYDERGDVCGSRVITTAHAFASAEATVEALEAERDARDAEDDELMSFQLGSVVAP